MEYSNVADGTVTAEEYRNVVDGTVVAAAAMTTDMHDTTHWDEFEGRDIQTWQPANATMPGWDGGASHPKSAPATQPLTPRELESALCHEANALGELEDRLGGPGVHATGPVSAETLANLHGAVYGAKQLVLNALLVLEHWQHPPGKHKPA